MGLAPMGPLFEKDRAAAYESDVNPNYRRRGPLRFEEGVATDTDVPREFQKGAYGDTSLGDNKDRPTWAANTKTPEETMRERAHIGSSTWIEAPALLGEFVQGASAGFNRPDFEMERTANPRRPNRAQVND